MHTLNTNIQHTYTRAHTHAHTHTHLHKHTKHTITQPPTHTHTLTPHTLTCGVCQLTQHLEFVGRRRVVLEAADDDGSHVNDFIQLVHIVYWY